MRLRVGAWVMGGCELNWRMDFVVLSFLEAGRALGLGLVMRRRLGCEGDDIVYSPLRR